MSRSRAPLLAYVAVTGLVSLLVATADEPVRAEVDHPVRAVVDDPVRAVVDDPVRGVVDEPVRGVVDEPVRGVVDEPVRGVVDEPVRGVVDEPVRAAVDQPVRAAVEEPVLVFAASSLGSVLDELKPSIERAAHTAVRFSYASSATLARQIEAGAPADIFISADTDWMMYLVGRHLVRGSSVVEIATNRLVLVAPARSPIVLPIAAGFPLREALGTGRLAVGEPETVPAGKYARSALEYLGVWDSVKDQLAPGENVRVALQFVARGECPLGIVYASDVKVEPGVRVVGTFPDEAVRPGISYPAGLVASRSNPAALTVLQYLQTRDARRIFVRYGFIVAWPWPTAP